MVRQYEAMYIIKPNLGDEETVAVIEKFKGLVENNGGQDVTINKWGKRRLAYEIDGLREGIYVVMNFSAQAPVAQELDRVLKISDEIMRHIIVRQNED